MKAIADKESRLSWVLAGLAGLVGAAAFVNTAGFFVTFMTGNTERAVVGFFVGQEAVAGAALALIVTFVSGVVVASVCRRRLWSDHPHGATVLTSFFLTTASIVDIWISGFG
ncbi:MAG: YoaK family protein, partial [Rhodococcus sp. (in: high G+C Gram-positive bacteria)]